MIVKLRELRPNPTRNFATDPINPASVEAIRTSIADDGFWGGIVCSRNNGAIHIAAGHHRVAAAIAEGIEEADLFVGEFDDEQLCRIYTRENATQRGMTGTARLGAVASAVYVLARASLTEGLSRILDGHDDSLTRIDADSEDGIGERAVLKLLKGSGISQYDIRQDLKTLKESGDYASTIAHVKERLETERIAAEAAAREAAEEEKAAAERKAQAAREAEERAAKAKAKADEREKVFDLAGVAKYITKSSHQILFRDLVTKPGVENYLPFDQQEPAAKALAGMVTKDTGEIDRPFIRENIEAAIASLKRQQRQATREEEEEKKRGDWQKQFTNLAKRFTAHLDGLISVGGQLALHIDKMPPGGTTNYGPALIASAVEAKDIIDTLNRRLGS